MGRLGPSELRSRLAFDWQVVEGLSSEHLGLVRAYASADEARANRALSPEERAAGRATCLSVE